MAPPDPSDLPVGAAATETAEQVARTVFDAALARGLSPWPSGPQIVRKKSGRDRRSPTMTIGTEIDYRSMSVVDYRVERIAELGEFIGSVIAGIYEGIRAGAYDSASDYEAVAGRPHQQWSDYFGSLSSRPSQ